MNYESVYTRLADGDAPPLSEDKTVSAAANEG
jgi:hypothetical protein